MIVLQFASGTDLESEAIEYFSHGQWSHVDAVLPDGSLLGARLEGGVAIRSKTYLGASKTERVYLPATDAQTSAFYAFLMAQVGKPYDSEAIAAFITGRDWRDPKAWYCSELDT